MGDKIERIKRRIHKPHGLTLVTLGMILSLGLGFYNTLSSNASFRQGFPGTGLFQVSASFGLLGPNGLNQGTSVILPGDAINGTLTVSSKAHKALQLFITFNVTGDTSLWGCAGGVCNDVGHFQAPSGPLSLSVLSTPVLPENSVYLTSDPNLQSFTRAPVTVNPGDNTFQFTISSDVLTPTTSFSVSFFANQ